MKAFRCPVCDNPIEPAAFEVDPRCRRCGEPFQGVTSALDKLADNAYTARPEQTSNGPLLSRGPMRLLLVGAVSLTLLSVTYATPRLEGHRPWEPGDRVPFAQWAGKEQTVPRVPSPSFSGYKLPSSGVAKNKAEKAGPGGDVAQAPLLASADPSPAQPNSPQRDEAARKKGPAKGAVTISPEVFNGVIAEIEDPSGKAMDHFYRTLLATAQKEPGALTRVTHWGASTLATDGITSAVRRKFQARFGDGGKGWVPITKAWKFIQQKDVTFRSRGFKPYHVASRRLGISNYGYGGVVGRSLEGAKATYKANAARMEVYYRKMKGGGKISISVDKQKPVLIPTRARPAEDAWAVITAQSPGRHKYTVRALPNGMVQLYGVTLENPGPGVVYDCVGLVGTVSSRLLHYKPKHIKEQVAHRQPDLFVFMFGGNELVNRKLNLDRYYKSYRKVLRMMRAGRPEASCLIMTPGDHGKNVDGKMVTDPLLLEVIKRQRKLAMEEGCGFYSTLKAMGGEGSASQWYRAVPRLISGDFAHLTSNGEQVMGAQLYKAYMKGFHHWLARRKK